VYPQPKKLKRSKRRISVWSQWKVREICPLLVRKQLKKYLDSGAFVVPPQALLYTAVTKQSLKLDINLRLLDLGFLKTT
jgi:hypothetical protein